MLNTLEGGEDDYGTAAWENGLAIFLKTETHEYPTANALKCKFQMEVIMH